ncbi:MAG: hypothetical protein GYB68_01125 [Chloroflexi bacterium]|nr:hypothetical protein [Chloroflexota bacterium]
MITRAFRLTDRFGRLLLKMLTWLGSLLTRSTAGVSSLLDRRADDPNDNARVETQVQSLSGLIVILLAAVGTLIFWATGSTGQSNAVIQLFFGNGEPVPVEVSQETAPSAAQAPPAPSAPGAPFSVSAGSVVYSMVVGGQEELFALTAGQANPVRLTDSPGDDRHPAWSPDGRQIAFSSQRNGNWDLFILDMESGEIVQITDDPAYESNPTWSSDSFFLAYEAYYENNLDIYIVAVDGSQEPIPVTRNPEPDYAPAWSPVDGGREIAYVSVRDGNTDVYVISLDDPREDLTRNVSQTPRIREDKPAWAPSGTALAYSAVEDGLSLVYSVDLLTELARPRVVGQGHSPAWSPDGGSLVFLADRRREGSLMLTGQAVQWDFSVRAFALDGIARYPDWSLATLPDEPRGSLTFAITAPLAPAYSEGSPEQDPSTGLYRLVWLPDVLADTEHLLSDRVDTSFIALRDAVRQRAGWDFLSRVGDVWWGIDYPPPPGQDERNWHKAGRAFNIIEEYNQSNPAQIELVPAQSGPDQIWRLYVRAAVQDGSLGEPLTTYPWDFYARTSGDLDAYENGGRFKDVIPSGYYIDFTDLAARYGWYPTPSNSSWRSNWAAILYWQYQKDDGLEWWQAMREIYEEPALELAFFTPTPAPTATATPTVDPDAVTPSPSPEAEATSTPTPEPEGENGGESQ